MVVERRHPIPKGCTIKEIVHSGLCPKCRKVGRFYAHKTAAGNRYLICDSCGYRYKTYDRKAAKAKRR